MPQHVEGMRSGAASSTAVMTDTLLQKQDQSAVMLWDPMSHTIIVVHPLMFVINFTQRLTIKLHLQGDVAGFQSAVASGANIADTWHGSEHQRGLLRRADCRYAPHAPGTVSGRSSSSGSSNGVAGARGDKAPAAAPLPALQPEQALRVTVLHVAVAQGNLALSEFIWQVRCRPRAVPLPVLAPMLGVSV